MKPSQHCDGTKTQRRDPWIAPPVKMHAAALKALTARTALAKKMPHAPRIV
jgi:hypothetical protein